MLDSLCVQGWRLAPSSFMTATSRHLLRVLGSSMQSYRLGNSWGFERCLKASDFVVAFGDYEAWQYELERARRSGSTLTSEQRTDAYRRQGDEMRRKILKHVTETGHLYRSELEEWMRSQGMASRHLNARTERALAQCRKVKPSV